MGSVILALSLLGLLVFQVFIPGFPKETLLLSAGLNFGLFWGTVINWVGMILAAQLGYETVLYSIRVGGRFSTLLEEYQESKLVIYLQDKGNLGLFLLRLVPYAPNDVLSLLSGALLLPRKGFFAVSVITALPYALIFAYLGAISSEFVSQDTLWLINAFLFVVTILVIGINYLYNRTWDKSRISTN